MNESNCSGLGEYVIMIRNHLDDEKSYWFEGLTMTIGFDDDGRPITTLTGHLSDQAALHGVLAKIRDMNLPLISVSKLEPGAQDETQSGKPGGRES